MNLHGTDDCPFSYQNCIPDAVPQISLPCACRGSRVLRTLTPRWDRGDPGKYASLMQASAYLYCDAFRVIRNVFSKFQVFYDGTDNPERP